jgi:hypothetical protein
LTRSSVVRGQTSFPVDLGSLRPAVTSSPHPARARGRNGSQRSGSAAQRGVAAGLAR